MSRKRQEWSFRLQRESRFSSSALFITLTYDNSRLPLDRNGIAHVSKRDCQTFLKRLRKSVSYDLLKLGFDDLPDLRYYLSSEYGPNTFRPHYHMILFNFPIKILDAYETILKTWKNGFVQVGPLRDGGAMYAAKYILHPLESLPYYLTKPFSLMSRRPGIGFNSITPELKKYCNENRTYLVRVSGGQSVPLPRYFRCKIFAKEDLDCISQTVLKNAQEDRERQFIEDCELYGYSQERSRNLDYARRVKKSLEKNKHRSKL